MGVLVVGLWIFDVRYAHVFDLLRRKKTKLNLLNRAQFRTGILKVEVRHDDIWSRRDVICEGAGRDREVCLRLSSAALEGGHLNPRRAHPPDTTAWTSSAPRST